MPLYEYQCDACGHRFETIQKFSDAPVATCTKCGKGPVHKLFSSPAIQFKGSGWYITDYAQKGKTDGGSSTGKSDAKTDSKAETKAETKTETKSETKTDAKTDTKTDTKSS
jgi:putative FmdB family regulatory protein